MKYDIIIIGAGLGGLTAGAKLAKEGRKVLVIEQHDRPGGCATTFKRGNYTLEVGLHEMDGPAAGEMKSRIFNDLDVSKNVEFLKVPEFYHFINGRHEVTIPHNPEIAVSVLCKHFPEEIIGINTYFNLLLTPKKKNKTEEPVIDISVGNYLDSIIHNEDLKLILLGNLGYFHDDPYSLSLGYYSVAQAAYFLYGGSYIKGGSQKLSDYLADYIRTHGGEVMLNHTVNKITVENNRATGVLFKRKNRTNEDSIPASGEEIIVNSSVPGLTDLLPEEYALKLMENIKDEKIGTSFLTIYFGFKKPLKELGSRYYSTFNFDESVKSQADIVKNNKTDFVSRSFTFVDYSQINSDLAPEGKSVGALCCIDYLKDWDHLSKEDYKARKEKVAGIFIDRLERIIPGIKSVIDYYEVGTSSTVKRYTLNPGGAAHGFAHTPGRKPNDYLKILDNLHFASAWTKTGGGFSGAIYGGYLCALNVMRKKNVTPKQ